MSESGKNNVNKAVDSIQQRLTSYACGLKYEDIPADVVHTAKVRVIDTLGALMAGFFGEPCFIARNVAAEMPDPNGATVIGTRMKTTPDMAAFVNATTSRYAEINDNYHWPGSFHGHASDTVTPVLAVAELTQAGGRDFITGVILAYEVYLRFSDVFNNQGFDISNFCCLSTAMAGGKLLGLTPEQLSHAISMAVVPNVSLKQVRIGHQSMFKAAATGQAGRAGVFAALLAQAGMEGPHLPFEGKAGWCDHVARKRFTLDTMGGNGTRFKIMDTQIKMRSSMGNTIPCILAAEKIAPIKSGKDIKKITVEIYEYARAEGAGGQHHWNPETRETADHSIPYITAVTLLDGTVTPRSFNDAHLWNPELRELLPKIEVVENPEFTKAFDRVPVQHRARVTVETQSGEKLVGETGGDPDDPAMPKSDAQIEGKFRGLTEDYLGSKRVTAILDRLWHLEDMKSVASIPSLFVLD